MWIGARLSAVSHHGRAHRFFSHARWCPDRLGLALAALIVERFLPAAEAVQATVDDTLFHRYGRKVHAAARQHDGSAPGRLGIRRRSRRERGRVTLAAIATC
jgi:hypothetical protein